MGKPLSYKFNELYDLAIIGGGINGVGIANDAAGRELSVILFEQGDIGGATSSASTKLIHGGLRYLENYEFRLVREALKEREILLHKAPHLIKPLEFIIPLNNSSRSTLLLQTGLFIYDHLARRSQIPGSRKINLSSHIAGIPLNKEITTGFSYYDCWADDARLAVANAKQATQHGALILPRTRVTHAQRDYEYWFIKARDSEDNSIGVRAKILINATGPWVTETAKHVLHINTHHHVKLVKGSHIIVKKLYEGEHAYLLQARDKRVVFVIPYENEFTLIGTTEEDFKGDPKNATIDEKEIHYLCDTVGEYFINPPTPQHVISHYAGVRPLVYESAKRLSEITRDYVFELNSAAAPLLTIFGGKLTTYRKLAENALKQLLPFLKLKLPAWTALQPLPGGDIKNFADYKKECASLYPFIPETLLTRYVKQYGSDITQLMQGKSSLQDLGENFGDNVYENEIRYLIDNEWAKTIDDILWRRTKLGMHVSPVTIQNLARYLKINL